MTNEEKSKIQAEILTYLDFRAHGRLLLSPRMGKTKMILDIIKRDKPMSILWVTPSKQLAKKDIPEEFKKWGAEDFISSLTTSTWMSLKNVKGFFDLVVFDEEQYVTSNNLARFFDCSLTYGNIISMTGTATKDKKKLELYELLSLPVLFKFDINEAVEKKVLSDYEMNIVKVPLSKKQNYSGGSKKKPFKTSEEKQYEYLNKIAEAALSKRDKSVTFKVRNRTNFIKNAPSKTKAVQDLLSTLTGKILIFAGSIPQSEMLCKHTYNSKTDDTDLNRFKAGEIDRIAMVKAGGIGSTYKKIDHLIIVQADSDKNGSTSQKITRTLLEQGDYKATIWIFCLHKTKDKVWVKSTLENFDKNKIKFMTWQENLN